MSTEFHEGDLVEAVKGETVIRGRIERERGDGDRPGLRLTLAIRGDMLNLRANGYTVSVIEKAAPKLPTEPGYYRVSGNNAASGGTLQLDTRGQWWWVGNEYQPNAEVLEADRLVVYLPLTRLEPVPVTAKRVLDVVQRTWPYCADLATRGHFRDIAAEFGVTE